MMQLDNLLLAHFFYGLSFIFLGLLILARFEEKQEQPLLRYFWLLGVFAVFHGASEWVDLVNFFSVKFLGFSSSAFLTVLSAALYFTSLFLLLQFPASVLSGTYDRMRWLKALPAALLLAAVGTDLAAGTLMGAPGRELMNLGAFWFRYLTGLAGGALTFLALVIHRRALLREMPRGILVATAMFFGLNAFLSLFTAFESSFHAYFQYAHPGSAGSMGYESLVHFLRALCAVSVTFSVSYTLVLTDGERNRQLLEKQEELGHANRQLKQTIDMLNEAREELVQSEKMKALGILVCGIAHEYNNHLTTIRGFAQLAESSDSLEGVREDLRVIELVVDQAAEITRNLLSFVRPDGKRKDSLDVNEAALGVVSLVRAIFTKKNIGIRTDFQAKEQAAIGQSAFQDIVLNLLINGQHAIEEKGSGVIAIATRSGQGNVVVTVSDDGCGIPAEHLRDIFLPFFTTKGGLGGSATQGTGLGLSVVYGLLKAHGGTIYVESEEGAGSTFTITLPAGAPPAAEAASRKVPGREHDAGLTGLRVLVIEDEEPICSLIRRALARRGVSVSCETGALPALKLFGETAFDMVFLDLVLPGMHGLECLKRLKEKRPEVPVVIISGGLRELLQEKLLCCGAQEFIQKPFDISQIVDALERRRGGPPARQSRAPVLSSCGSA